MTIPSQRRYVQYYGHLLKNNLTYSPKTVLLKALKFIGVPNIQGGTCGKSSDHMITDGNSCVCLLAPYFSVKVQKVKIYSSKVYDVSLH